MTQPLDHLAALVAAQHTFAETLVGADPETPVPWCPPWRVADLALHLGGVHWWAAGMAHGVDLDPREPPGPRDVEALVRFYVWAAGSLRRTLVDLGPNAPALTLVGAGPAFFWHRRQLHETLVHLWDLRAATALAGEPALPRDEVGTAPHGLGAELADDVAPQVWADTVDEVVGVMHPRQVVLGRVPPLDVAVHLVAQDVDRHWTLPHAADEGAASVTVTGSTASLALLLWGRLGPGHPLVEVQGDRRALDVALAAGPTPGGVAPPRGHQACRGLRPRA